MDRDNETTTEHAFTDADTARAFIRKAPPGTRFYLHVRMDARIVNDPDHYAPGAFCAGVGLSRKDALSFIRDAWMGIRPERNYIMRMRETVRPANSRWCKRTDKVVQPKNPDRAVWIG